MAKATKDIIKKSKNEVAVVDFLKEAKAIGDGFENVDQSMFSMPFLKIAIGQSPEVLNGQIKGLAPGMMFNSVSGSVYGKKTKLVICGFQHSYLRFGPDLGDFRGIYSPEEMEQKAKEGLYERDQISTYNSIETTKDKKGKAIPAEKCMDAHVLYVMSAEKPEDGVMIFTFKMSGIKHSRKWITKARAVKIHDEAGNAISAPIYASVWEVETMLNTNDQGSWFLLGDKKTCLINQVGTLLDKEYAALQGPVLEAVGFVRNLIDQGTKINLSGSVDPKEATIESEEDFD